jgi:hypothetical protein
MSYLPDSLDQVKVLITVKTYPLPSNKYQELVCTAGVLEDGRWIRIYPIPFRSLPQNRQFVIIGVFYPPTVQDTGQGKLFS